MTKSYRWRVFKRDTYLNVAVLPDMIKSGVPGIQIDGAHRVRSTGDTVVPFCVARGDRDV